MSLLRLKKAGRYSDFTEHVFFTPSYVSYFFSTGGAICVDCFKTTIGSVQGVSYDFCNKSRFSQMFYEYKYNKISRIVRYFTYRLTSLINTAKIFISMK